MRRNMGAADRIIRSILAVIISLLYFGNALKGEFGALALICAVVFMLTSIFGFSPIYALLGLDTFRKDNLHK